MLSDLFSSFDPGLSAAYCVSPYLFWGRAMRMTIFLSPVRFIESVRIKVIIGTLVRVIINLLKDTKGNYAPGAGWVLRRLFLFLLIVNISGIIP